MKKIAVLKIVELLFMIYMLLSILGAIPANSRGTVLFFYTLLAILGTVIFNSFRRLNIIIIKSRILDLFFGAILLFFIAVEAMIIMAMPLGKLFIAIAMIISCLQFIILLFINNRIFFRYIGTSKEILKFGSGRDKNK